jgi:FKBP-type peptidyl-prolyl cis-trans isomerase
MSSYIRTKIITAGQGAIASTGDTVCISCEAFLPRGDVAFKFDNFSLQLGKRAVIAGLEMVIEGMREGETREAHVPPHLGYGDGGAPNIPANASLKLIITLLQVKKTTGRGS